MSKKMLTIASILMTCLFIAMLAMIFSIVSDEGSNAGTNTSTIINTTYDRELDRFNGTVVTGDIVMDTINNFRQLSDGRKLGYYVKFPSGTSAVYGYYSLSSVNTSTHIITESTIASYSSYLAYEQSKYLTDTDKARLILKGHKYKANIIRGTKGDVFGIQFIYTAS